MGAVGEEGVLVVNLQGHMLFANPAAKIAPPTAVSHDLRTNVVAQVGLVQAALPAQ